MSVTPTYPGVYIEEIPSGVRTLTGVATSITAFLGRALRGPTDADGPVTINSYGDFERIFGGLWTESAMSFAVRDFFQNGGSQAMIVRLYHAKAAPPNSAALLHVDSLTLVAASPGAWGNQLRARIDHSVRPALAGEEASKMFNLFIRDGGTGMIEEFRNVSVESGHPRQLDKVLTNMSKLVRVNGLLPDMRPAESLNSIDPGQTVWDDNKHLTNYKVEIGDQASDGDLLDDKDFNGKGKESAKQGLFALEKADLFNILCIPPYLSDGNVGDGVITAAATYCEKRRAFYILDCKPTTDWADKDKIKTAVLATSSKNAAIFFPRIQMANPLRDNQIEEFAACGAIAGIFARTDAQRGIWKAPAGMEATLNGVPQLAVSLTDAEIGELNPLGVNCLKLFPGVGRVVWGSRTLQGNDKLASEWKYIPVRRFALYIEESLYRGTQWVVFEPNDEPLWAQIRLNLGSFMHGLFRQGAFQGTSPREAYFVKCDKETTTQADVDRGVVNILVGFAPLKPAEFVIIQIQQIAGQIQA